MKILFLGDYSNVHATLAREMRRRGHQVTLVGDGGGSMRTDTDIYLTRGSGMAAGLKYLYRIMSLLPQLKDYDVVQLVNPQFLKLRPGKNGYFYRQIRRENGPVFLTLAGNDYFFVDACCHSDMFRFSEFRIGREKTRQVIVDPEREYGWFANGMREYCEDVYETVKGAMSLLPEYDMASRPVLGDRLVYTGLPLDLSDYRYSEPDLSGKIRIMVGYSPSRMMEKGTDILLRIAQELAQEMPETVEAAGITGLPLNDYLRELSRSHIVLDQLYSYSPGMNALQTMAFGGVAASGAQPEFYSMAGEETARPLIALAPTDSEPDIKERIRALVENRAEIARLSREGRAFVERNNDVRHVADLYEKVWNK